MTNRKIFILTLSLILLISTGAAAQFRIKIPGIKKPKPETKKPVSTEVASSTSRVSNPTLGGQNRQDVMDDGFTFFDAEPVEEYDRAKSLNKDVGWYLISYLRVLGDYPNRSAFKVIVKKNGSQLSQTRCNATVYSKEKDSSLSNAMRKVDRDLTYENFMYTNVACKKKTAVIKPTGKLDVEIYIVDGDTDDEKLVRTYKIDVHRAPRVRGSTTNPQPDVAHYYIERNAEAGVAFVHYSHAAANYFKTAIDSSSGPYFSTLVIYSSYSPGRSGRLPNSTYARCKVNGQPLKLEWDQVNIRSEGTQEYAVYTDRLLPQYKRGPAYRDDVIFRRMSFKLPLYTGETQYSKPRMKIENTPGDWECKVLSNGELYRTFRWKVGSDGMIVRHAEQLNGNINLFHNTFLVDMEIPAGGTEWDFRLAPMPNNGLFYGIPWTTPEGKAMSARVPKKGNPFHVTSKQAGK